MLILNMKNMINNIMYTAQELYIFPYPSSGITFKVLL